MPRFEQGCSYLHKGVDNIKDLDKDKRINAEIKRLNTILKNMDKEVKKSAKSFIENASFMAITLEDLQISINRDGPVCEYKNGENQFGTKKSPEIDIYNTMVKNHMAIMKQLNDLLPKGGNGGGDDGFDSFINSR